MKLIPVDSSGVRAVGYEEERKILHIRFIDGDIYQYYGGPVGEVVDLLQSKSIGRFVNKRIKSYYNCRKLKATS